MTVVYRMLTDILTAIEEIESFFGDKPKLFDDFYSNLCLRRAIERNIEIIGEAMNRILKKHSYHQFTQNSGRKKLYHSWI